MPSSTLSAFGAILRARSTEFREEVHRRFFLDVLEARQVFPLSLGDTHVDLAVALAWVMDRTPVGATMPEPVLERLRTLGRDHRRHGFPAEVYPAFAEALRHGLRAVTDEDEFEPAHLAAVERVLVQVCGTMAEAAREADLAGEAPATAAEVVAVERRSRRFSVVRLEAGMPLIYRPGQHVPVTAPYLPGTWRMLSPALPSDEHGQLEFHVQTHGTPSASQLLATARPGDYWTLGTPRGGLEPQGARGVVMIAHATGLAPLRAILFGLLTVEHPPQVHLFVGAEYPGELYDLAALWQLSKALSWLSVIPVVEQATDAWWVGSTVSAEPRRWLLPRVAEEIGQAVLDSGPWPGYEVLVAGGAERVRATVDTLLAGGFHPDSIRFEEWGRPSEWAGA